MVGSFLEEILESSTGFLVASLEETGTGQAEAGVIGIRRRRPTFEKSKILLGGQIEFPLTEQPVGEAEGLGNAPLRGCSGKRGCFLRLRGA